MNSFNITHVVSDVENCLKIINVFKDRVTKPQKKMLITLLRETKYMEGKKEKEWYWEKIQAALNTIGPKKTIIQWKKVSILAVLLTTKLIINPF